jgi:hypothetical protein
MASSPQYSFSIGRCKQKDANGPVLRWPPSPDWATVRWTGAEGSVGRSGRWAKFTKGIENW